MKVESSIGVKLLDYLKNLNWKWNESYDYPEFYMYNSTIKFILSYNLKLSLSYSFNLFNKINLEVNRLLLKELYDYLCSEKIPLISKTSLKIINNLQEFKNAIKL